MHPWKRKCFQRLQHYINIKPYLRQYYFSSKKLLPIPFSDLKGHAFIVGQSGSGKSELMKLLFYKLQYQSEQKRQYSLILLDPHGDLAKQVASFDLNKNSNRFMRMNPYLENEYTPTFNCFDCTNKSEENIDRMAQGIKQVIQECLK